MITLADNRWSGSTVLATYYVEAARGADALALAKKFATGQTVGTWIEVPGLSEAMGRKRTGRVADVREIPPVELSEGPTDGPRRLIVSIEFPWENFGESLSMLLTALLGMDASTSIRAKLIDVLIPKEYAAIFPGPRVGAQEVARKLGAAPGSPLLLNMIKPCLGFGPKEGAELFREASAAGPDLIKDDELLASPDYCPVIERTKSYLDAPGVKPYCPNVTAPSPRLLDLAKRVVDLGAAAVMVNFVFAGLDAVRSLADLKLGVPIMVHYAGAGSLFESPRSGLASSLILGKLPRLAGADLIHLPSPYGAYPFHRERAILAAAAQRAPLHDLAPGLPVLGGGLVPGLAPKVLSDFGPEVMLAVGGSIQGHPGGAKAGVTAWRAALEAAAAGLGPSSADSPELAEALRLWGPDG